MEFAAVLAHYAEDDGKAEAGANACRLGSEERIEYACLNALRNSRAVVGHFQEDTIFCNALGLYADGATCPLIFDGLTGIADKINEHLLELPGVAVHEGEHGLEIKLDMDIFRNGIKPLQLQRPGDDLVQGDTAPL